jgi:hypothetical protein
MDRACSIHGKDAYPERRRPFMRCNRKWEDNIKMDND